MKLHTAELSAWWREDYGIDVGSEFDGAPAIELLCCPRCAVSHWRPLSAAGSPALYEQLGKFDWYYQQDKWEFHASLDDLPREGRILEVGCGSGKFLDLAGAGKARTIEGLETNPVAARTARSKGHTVQECELAEAAGREPGGYDGLCAFQVLEHLTDPAGFLEAACEILRPGGILVLAVPNGASFIAKMKRHLLDMPPHHITRWTAGAMNRLPQYFPLRVVRVCTEPLSRFHLPLYVNAHLASWPIGRFPRKVLGKLMTALLSATGTRRFLTGHTLYACFQRE